MTGSPGQIRSLMWLDMTPSWCAKIFQSVFFQILYLVVQYHWYWVSTGQYLLVLWGNWSVWGGNGWYLVLLGQYRAVLVVTRWYWVSLLRHWLVLGDNGSKPGGTGCQCDMISESILFTWCKPSNYSIFGEGKSDDRQTNKQTDFLI